jgi:hypothetical protein
LKQIVSPFFSNYQNPIALMSGARHVSLHIPSNFWHEAFLFIPCVSPRGSKAFMGFSSEIILY